MNRRNSKKTVYEVIRVDWVSEVQGEKALSKRRGLSMEWKAERVMDGESCKKFVIMMKKNSCFFVIILTVTY